MSTQPPDFHAGDIPTDARIAIAAARFNAPIVDELIASCRRRLKELNFASERIELHRVPGAFELPLAAKLMADSGHFAAVICLGAVIRGDTPHFDYVAGQAAAGIQQAALTTSLPIIFGVLTTETHQQALDRIGGSHGHAGRQSAEAAVEMIAVMSRIRRYRIIPERT
jgi:6,7-dimethyl-8-ribityllumazine synthase